MTFPKQLRRLLKICNVKIFSLAEHLGYDPSYVSKWLSGAKLPSESGIAALTEKIAAFCEENANEQIRRELCSELSLPPSTEANGVRAGLMKLLLSAYWSDKNIAVDDGVIPVEVVERAQSSLIVNAVSEALCAALSPDVPIEMIVSSNAYVAFLGFSRENELGGSADVTVFFDYRRYEGDPVSYCRDICAAISSPAGLNAHIFEGVAESVSPTGDFCIVKDTVLVQIALEPLTGRAYPVVLRDADTVNASYYTVKAFVEKQMRVETYSNGDEQYSKFLYRHYMNSRQMLLYRQMFFGEAGIIDELEKSGALRGMDKERLLEQHRCACLHENLRIIFESVLLDTVRNGRARVSTDYPNSVELGPAVRKQLLESLVQSNETGVGNKTYRILKDVNPLTGYNDNDASVFVNSKQTTINRFEDKDVFYILSPFGVEAFNAFISDIEALPEKYLLTVEQTSNYIREAIRVIDDDASECK